jgi:hypothetical protein
MRDRLRRHSDDERRQENRGTPHPGDAEGEDGIDELRAETADLLDAASAAIGRALSGDSKDFIHNVRQSGGQ